MPHDATPIKAVIFDFDGTIADSFDAFVDALKTTTKRKDTLSKDEIETLRGLSTKEVIKRLDIKPWRIPSLLVKGRREMKARYGDVTMFAGMTETFKELAQTRSLYIVSTNSEGVIMQLLEKYGADTHVTRVYGNSGLFDKAKSLTKVCAKESLNRAECVYVGDGTRDIEAAKKAGMRSIAVARGYNTPEVLRAHKPDNIAFTPEELTAIIR